MNPFGWKKWKELPYRGESQPKYPRRKRQSRNLKKERRKNLILIAGVAGIITLGIGFIAMHPTLDRAEKLTGIIAILVVALPFAIAIISGMMSINRFRKGYDIDISEVSKRGRSKCHENTIDQ
jgi:hypothetical protein